MDRDDLHRQRDHRSRQESAALDHSFDADRDRVVRERGYQIRPATLTSPSIFLQNLIPAWIAEDGFPPTIWQMLLPSSRTTRSARCKISVRVLAMMDVEKVRGLDPSSVGRVEHP